MWESWRTKQQNLQLSKDKKRCYTYVIYVISEASRNNITNALSISSIDQPSSESPTHDLIKTMGHTNRDVAACSPRRANWINYHNLRGGSRVYSTDDMTAEATRRSYHRRIRLKSLISIIKVHYQAFIYYIIVEDRWHDTFDQVVIFQVRIECDRGEVMYFIYPPPNNTLRNILLSGSK